MTCSTNFGYTKFDISNLFDVNHINDAVRNELLVKVFIVIRMYEPIHIFLNQN